MGAGTLGVEVGFEGTGGREGEGRDFCFLEEVEGTGEGEVFFFIEEEDVLDCVDLLILFFLSMIVYTPSQCSMGMSRGFVPLDLIPLESRGHCRGHTC